MSLEGNWAHDLPTAVLHSTYLKGSEYNQKKQQTKMD